MLRVFRDQNIFITEKKCTYSAYSCITLFLVCFSCFPRTRIVSGPYYLRILTLGLDTLIRTGYGEGHEIGL